MKCAFFFLLGVAMLAPNLAQAHSPLGGVYFICSYDPDQERHFEGVERNAMEDEARKIANEKCDSWGAGVATHIVYVFKDGSQESQ